MEMLIEILAHQHLRRQIVELCTLLDADYTEDDPDDPPPPGEGNAPAYVGHVLAHCIVELVQEVRAQVKEDQNLWEADGDNCFERDVAQQTREYLSWEEDEDEDGLPDAICYRDPSPMPKAAPPTGLSVQAVGAAQPEQDALCLHPRLSLEVYTGETGCADDRGDWMCIQCGETFVSRAAAEKDRQRVRALVAKVAGAKERNEEVS